MLLLEIANEVELEWIDQPEAGHGGTHPPHFRGGPQVSPEADIDMAANGEREVSQARGTAARKIPEPQAPVALVDANRHFQSAKAEANVEATIVMAVVKRQLLVFVRPALLRE